jgi:hypothetical protein
MKSAGMQSMNVIKMASVMIPSIKKQVKVMGEERMAEALSDDEKMGDFSKEIYVGLPISVKMKVDEDSFIGFMLANKTKLMKKKKNRQKVEKHLNSKSL